MLEIDGGERIFIERMLIVVFCVRSLREHIIEMVTMIKQGNRMLILRCFLFSYWKIQGP